MTLGWELAVRLLAAGILGGLIGLQRELAGKPAGLRTHFLVSLGCALFTVASLEGFPSADPARVAAGIVTGIGFLGAGAIIRGGEGIVVGLTTAASVWAVAAIGLAVGTGLYLLALVATALVGGVLFLPKIKG